MAKLISVSDDVYSELTRLKGKESYSRVLRRLLSEKSNKSKIMDFFGSGAVDASAVKELSGGWKKWSETLSS